MPTKPRPFRPQKKAPRRPDRRQSAAVRGYDRTWRALRAAHLLANPLCEHCKQADRLTAAQEVHHDRGFDGPHDPLRLDPANLVSLCKPCHSRVTAAAGRRRG